MIGLFSDRIGRINIAGLSTLIAGVAALVIWIPGGKSYGGLIVYALFGLFAGALWPTVAPVGAEVVGIQLLPAGTIYLDPNVQFPPLWGTNLLSLSLSLVHLLAFPCPVCDRIRGDCSVPKDGRCQWISPHPNLRRRYLPRKLRLQ